MEVYFLRCLLGLVVVGRHGFCSASSEFVEAFPVASCFLLDCVSLGEEFFSGFLTLFEVVFGVHPLRKRERKQAKDGDDKKEHEKVSN